MYNIYCILQQFQNSRLKVVSLRQKITLTLEAKVFRREFFFPPEFLFKHNKTIL